MLAIDDFEYPSVKAAWSRYREGGGAILEHVVAATEIYFATSWVRFFGGVMLVCAVV